MAGTYGFLLDTYETEILKITSIWTAFPAASMDYRRIPNRAAYWSRWSTKSSRRGGG